MRGAVIKPTQDTIDGNAVRAQYSTVLGGPRAGAEIPLTDRLIEEIRDGRAVTLRT